MAVLGMIVVPVVPPVCAIRHDCAPVSAAARDWLLGALYGALALAALGVARAAWE